MSGALWDGERWAKKCITCRTVFCGPWHSLLTKFPRHGSNIDGLQSECRKCHHERASNWQFLRKYKITKAEASRILAAQNHRCDCCGRLISFDEPKGARNRAVMDHSHETGNLRGILCHPCNIAIGNMDESPRKCLLLHGYLTKHSSNVVRLRRV